jgi:hypothetical protein
MLIIERRNSAPRWYYIVFGIALLSIGSFGALLTMDIRWRPNTKKKA